MLFAPRILALGLGEIHVTSKLGEYFSGRIPIISSPGESVDPSCFKLLTGLTGQEGIPLIGSARLTVSGGSGGLYLKVSSRKRISDLAVRLLISAGCGDREITREYIILLDMPDNVQTSRSDPAVADVPLIEPILSLPTKPVLPASQSGLRSGGMEWEAMAGESLSSIAANIYPNSRRMQRKFIRHVIASNSEVLLDKNPDALLPAGIVLHIPNLRELARNSIEEKSGRRLMAESTAQPDTKPEASAISQKTAMAKKPLAGADVRLKLTTGDLDISASSKITEGEREVLREKQRILMDIDDMAAFNLSLNHRLKSMEERIQELQAKLDHQRSEMALNRPASPAIMTALSPEPRQSMHGWNAYTNMIAYSAGGLGLLGAAFWVYLKRQKNRAEDVTLADLNAELGRGWGVAPVIKEPGSSSLPSDSINASAQPERVVVPVYTPEIDQQVSSVKVPKERHYFHDPSFEITLGIVESAIEEADIYLVLGEKGRAISHLKDSIDSQPKSTADVWLKLLEIYRNFDMRPEFETLAVDFHQCFNIAKPDWETMASKVSSSRSIEQFPHLMEKISSTWGSAGCLEYLRHILLDNREGLREGFELDIASDILLLIRLLEVMLGQSADLPDGESHSEENRAMGFAFSEAFKERHGVSGTGSGFTLGRVNSQIEEADLYLVLGAKGRAISHLKDRIESRTSSTADVWLKLLEIYRNFDMQPEFEALATEFGRYFNIAKPSWQMMAPSDSSFHSIEQFPRLMEKISSTWGSPACLEYLRQLLLDDRGGIREGFELGIASDIFLLIHILEWRLEKFSNLPPGEVPSGEIRELKFTFEAGVSVESETSDHALSKLEPGNLPEEEPVIDSLLLNHHGSAQPSQLELAPVTDPRPALDEEDADIWSLSGERKMAAQNAIKPRKD